MANDEFLKYLITEDLYLVPEKEGEETVEASSKPYEQDSSESSSVVEEPQPAQEEVVVNYLGGFEKKVLILVEDAQADHLNETDKAYLLKILGAVKLGLEDIALVNLNRTKNVESLDAEITISFASNAMDTKYTIQTKAGKKVLFADPLSAISKSTELRTALWNALKELFGV